jgi:sugar phosphate isomerase/epimerase
MNIGVLSESFKLPIGKVIEIAARLGVGGIQGYAASGELSPGFLDSGARKRLLRHMQDAGLVFPALCGDLGGHGFQLPAENGVKIEMSKAIADLAADLAAPVVTTHIGVIPEDSDSPTYAIMQESCFALGEYARKRGVSFAIETGPEPPSTLNRFIENLGTDGIGVNYDPANLVMVLGVDCMEGVRLLADHILHTHAKDGIHLADCDPVAVYEGFAVGGIEGFDFGTCFSEVPIGEGSVPWDGYLEALRDVGYDGFLTIEREVGDHPLEDIEKAVKVLRSYLQKITY